MDPTERMDPTKRRPVTEIIEDLNPRMEDYFNRLLRFIPIQARPVNDNNSWTYEPLVEKTRAYSYMGEFYNYLIRREIYNLMGEEATDRRASSMEKVLEKYNNRSNVTETDHVPNDANVEPETDEERECSVVNSNKLFKAVSNDSADEKDIDELNPVSSDDDESEDEEWPVHMEYLQKLVDSYQEFKNPKNATLDIIEHVFNTSTLKRIWFNDPPMPYDPRLLNVENIKAVLKYVGTLDRTNIVLHPDVGCEYFHGYPNLIFDDVLFLINTSKFPFQVRRDKCRRHMYQLILYAMGAFLRDNKEIRKFKVYNPLLGFEYFFELPHLDFDEFRKLLEQIKPSI